MIKRFFSRVKETDADDDILTVGGTPKENVFKDVLSKEIVVLIASFLPLRDLNNLSRSDQFLLMLFFNMNGEKALAIAKRKTELAQQGIETRILSLGNEYKDGEEMEIIQQLIWKPMVIHYFPNYSASLNVKNWMHVMRRRVIHLQNKHANELPFTKLVKGEETPKGGKYRDNAGRSTFIENCEWEYQCPLKIDGPALTPVRDGVKFCSVCKENVYEVMNQSEFDSHVQQDHCVSFSVFSKKERMMRLMGKPARPPPVR